MYKCYKVNKFLWKNDLECFFVMKQIFAVDVHWEWSVFSTRFKLITCSNYSITRVLSRILGQSFKYSKKDPLRQFVQKCRKIKLVLEKRQCFSNIAGAQHSNTRGWFLLDYFLKNSYGKFLSLLPVKKQVSFMMS